MTIPEHVDATSLSIHLRGHRILRGEMPVPVEPRVFDLLVLLMERQGAQADRTAIVERVWGGKAVSGDAIGAAVRDLRRALGDSRRDQRLVQKSMVMAIAWPCHNRSTSIQVPPWRSCPWRRRRSWRRSRRL